MPREEERGEVLKQKLEPREERRMWRDETDESLVAPWTLWSRLNNKLSQQGRLFRRGEDVVALSEEKKGW
jgi:hypothetical protein